MNVKTKNNAPILLTGAERSGVALIARIFSIVGLKTVEPVNNLLESKAIHNILDGIISQYSKDTLYPKLSAIPINVENNFSFLNHYKSKLFVKSSLLTPTWKIWNQIYPNAQWIIVRRKTSDIINSCIKTGYMKLFKNKENLEKLGLQNESEGWLWLVHQYEKDWVEMIQAGLDIKIIWPERMVDGDYSQINQMLSWLGLEWNLDIVNVIDPLVRKGEK